ncbi:THO complex subunit 1 transcription elongation factor-domain-containing protein [Aspergillus pseudodeflectus]|uniref:THO complex subunit 1 transcription elongation factor-domain-containing protein n=1 Tax=Aspergillus pseudodeflectus TaxID=176178 RepID=A0ABR4JDC1_9EURO
MENADGDVVDAYRRSIGSLMAKAEEAKPGREIEPPLTETQLGESFWLLPSEDDQLSRQYSLQTRFAAVEIAFRERFYNLLATISIDDPGFIQIWNLLDIISVSSDNEQCEPGLIFWLIEELLDSQTIEGCRKVFDYLESRRERNTKVPALQVSHPRYAQLTLVKKHFKQKSLIILRTCNELLRRLSRAEDTVFCGRVFIFLFQSFPLGDKSAVNLRGEYHTENVTTFDTITKESTDQADGMDVDMLDIKESTPIDGSRATERQGVDEKSNTQDLPGTPKVTITRPEDQTPGKSVDLDSLYPVFWGLQAYFSAPTRVFDTQHFATFKTGLESTLSAFKNVKTDLETSNSKSSEEIRKSNKRKRTADGPEIASSFNPKYLTSRELFDLEVNDTAFRRHVLVQALILLDFMLSLTPQSKSKLADLTNKSVLYGFSLSEENAIWATKMRKSIEEYLQEGVGGKFYYRMVDTVLSRDKNWVRWKAEGCPPIEKPAVSVTEYINARENATRTYSNKRLRASPMGSLDLKFLSESESSSAIDRLKESERFNVPVPETLMRVIEDNEFDIDMAQTNEDKESAVQAKASKTWLMLRLSAKSKLTAFEKIDDGKNLKILFEVPQANESTLQPATNTPQDSTTKLSQETENEPNGPAQDQDAVQDQDNDVGAENDTVMAEPKAREVNDATTTDAPEA